MALLLTLLTLLLGLSACGASGEEQSAPGARGGNVSIPLGEARRQKPLPLPRIMGASDPARPLVVIDPGHGGRDPGALSPFDKVAEKDITLAIALAVRDDLAVSGRVRVALTRNGDDHLSLQDRYETARRLGADLFISLHADSALREDARGASIYTLSEVASDREAAQLAARENGSGVEGAATLTADSGVNRILIDLAQREAMTRSAAFARLLHREASPLIPFQPDYHRFASLVVLKAPDIPSILFETGYLTNEADVAFLSSAQGRRRIAQGVRSAVETHLARRSGTTRRDGQAAAGR
jgi:N-acetylmuramoyl-L-alanine amidase